jgi:hypothetical protein
MLSSTHCQIPISFCVTARHATEGITDRSITDEAYDALHVAAAIHCCRFQRVARTMWAMVNEGGGDLTEDCYKALFLDPRGEQGVPYYERSPKALQIVVKTHG